MKSIESAWRRSGLTQNEFAARAGISARTLRRYIKAPSVPKYRRAAIANVSFEATHTPRQIARRRERLQVTANRRARVEAARQDTRPLKFVTLSGEATTVTGRRAGEIRAAYESTNQKRARMGLPSLSPSGYYGDPGKVLHVLRSKQTLKALRSRQTAGREGFKKSVRTSLQYANVDPGQIRDIMERLEQKSGAEIDELYRMASRESWDIITSPVDEGTHLPKVPDVSGIFAWLGVERKRLNIKL